MTKQNTFRYDINALRAIAVMGVVLFHFKVPYFSGGFSGVDIFFVISGYLMSKIIINGLKTDSFSIIGFYNKRGQRIMPALIFLVLVLIVINFFIYLPIDYQLLTKNATASLLFYSNILYFSYSRDYFDASSTNNILLHTWSLSVEWQFYLILPIVLYVFNRFFKNDKNKYLILFTITTILIFVFALIISHHNPSASFYLLPTRAWEMLLGGIAFLVEDKVRWRFKSIAAITGYIILIICFSTLNESMTWPGLFTLIPVSATFLIIVSNYNSFKFLKVEVTQLIGKISYSLYLWHWPIYVMGSYLGVQISSSTIIIFLALSILMALISYRYIENIKINTPKNVIITLSILLLITCSFTFKSLNEVLFKKKTILISNYRENHKTEANRQLNRDTCYVTTAGKDIKDYNKEQCLCIKEGERNVVLIGDSHSAHFSQSLRETLQGKGVHLIQISLSGCLPILKKNGISRCHEMIDYFYFNYLPKNINKIDGVIISANWINSKDSKDQLVVNLKGTVAYLKKLNVPVVIFGQNETYTMSYPAIAAREYEYNSRLSDKYLDAKSFAMNNILKAELRQNYIDIYSLNNFPKISPSLSPYMADDNHFTKYGADCVVADILKDKMFLDFIK